jgi:kumamolisin
MAKARIALPGSAKVAVPGAKPTGATDPNEQMEVTVRIRGKNKKAVSDKDLMKLGAMLPADRPVMDRTEFASKYGADQADLDKVSAFAHEHGLAVTHASAGQKMLRLRGTVASFNEAFGVKLKTYKKGRTLTYRGRTGSIMIPKELQDVIVGVHGLDNRPVATSHARLRKSMPGKRAVSSRNASDGSLTAPQVAELYNFPSSLTGAGQCIGLIELNTPDQQTGKPVGAGYATADLTAYFKGLRIPAPVVVPVSVDGGANLPGVDTDADGEVTLDIEVAGAVAPGATIAVYFAPNTSNGFIDAVNTAVHDTQQKPSVISISWGGPEDPNGQVDQQFIDGLNQAITDAAQLGVTICCAAGDDGSADMSQGWDKKPHCDFPSSSPFSLACGGTKLVGDKTTISSEVVWNEGTQGGAGGGGVSNVFPLPSYQDSSKVPKSPKKKSGRGVPDLAGDADPDTGYQIFLAGKQQVIGGTSAVAPLTAGLIALINQSLTQKSGKTAGFINPLLYGSASSAFRDITQGNNDIEGNLKGKYTAGKGWDACTGLGVPDGTKLQAALGG